MFSKYLIAAGKGLIWILGALLIAFFAASVFYRDIPAAELEAKWATPPSKFVDVDGLRVHVRDEGQGPALVLIHANYANLFMWEPWAAALKDRYRVIRFDMSSYGLTGPDATGDYRMERTVATLGKLVDTLGLTRFSLGGTSLGGTVAMHYAGANPARIEHLILLSPGSLEKDVRGRNTPVEISRTADVFTWITPRALARVLLENGYGDKTRITDAAIDQWYTFWRREGNRAAMLERQRQYVSGDVEGKIRAVTAPVLLLWGDKNPRVPVALAYEFQKLLVSSPKVELKIFPGVGHMAVNEAPEETARAVREYLDAAAANSAAVSNVAKANIAVGASQEMPPPPP
jgi:pimeloyl-ACP methyl ester carboxylesterase